MDPIDFFFACLSWAVFGVMGVLLAASAVSICVITIIWAYQLVRDLTRP